MIQGKPEEEFIREMHFFYSLTDTIVPVPYFLVQEKITHQSESFNPVLTLYEKT